MTTDDFQQPRSVQERIDIMTTEGTSEAEAWEYVLSKPALYPQVYREPT